MPRPLVYLSCGTGWNGTQLMVVRSADKVRSCELKTSCELNITPIYQKGYIMSVYTSTYNGYLVLLQNGLFITKWVFFYYKMGTYFYYKMGT